MPKKLTKRLKQNNIKANRKLTKRNIRIEISFVLLNNQIGIFLIEKLDYLWSNTE